MSESISIQDTHRLPYSNATVNAVKMENGNTTPLHFFDSEDVDLGENVYTNAKGFICDSNGTLYTSGIFVKEAAEIILTLRDGSYTTWRVKATNDSSVNDGVLYGKTPESPENDPVLVPVFSANSSDPGYLRWGNILDKPGFNQWSENEENVRLEADNDSVTLGKFTKTVTVSLDPDFATSNASHFRLTVTPHPARYAQVVTFRNETLKQLVLLAPNGDFIAKVNPANVGGVPNSTIVALHRDNEFVPAIDSQGICEMPDVALLDTVPLVRCGIFIDDHTPDLYRVVIPAALAPQLRQSREMSTVLILPVTLNNTRRRKIRLWLLNQSGGGARIMSGGAIVCSVANTEIVELMCLGSAERGQTGPYVVPLVNKKDPYPRESVTLDGNTGEVNVPYLAEKFTLEVSDNSVTDVTVWIDGFTSGFTAMDVHNDSDNEIAVNVKTTVGAQPIAVSVAQVTVPAHVLSHAVIRRAGTSVSILGPNGPDIVRHVTPVNATDRGGSATAWYSADVATGDELIDIDLAWLAVTHGMQPDKFGSWGVNYDDIVVALPLAPEGETRTFKFNVKPYVTNWGNNSIRLSVADTAESANNKSGSITLNDVWPIDNSATVLNTVRSRVVVVSVTKSSGTITATWQDWAAQGV